MMHRGDGEELIAPPAPARTARWTPILSGAHAYQAPACLGGRGIASSLHF
jgi:hypothetical protein